VRPLAVTPKAAVRASLLPAKPARAASMAAPSRRREQSRSACA